jgi:hypothetical protein
MSSSNAALLAHAVIITKDWSGRGWHGGIWEGEIEEGSLKGFRLAFLPKKQNIRFHSDDNNPQWSYSLNSKKRTAGK